MVYYDEYYRTLAKSDVFVDSANRGSSRVRAGMLRGFRTLGPIAAHAAVVPDHIADPHAWFLTSVKEHRSRENDSKALFDKGHTCMSEAHEVDTVDFVADYEAPKWSGNIRRASGFCLTPSTGMVPAHPDFGPVTRQLRPAWPDDLANFGQQAISRSSPQLHTISGSQFLSELREGLPSLIGLNLLKGRAKDVLKNAGSEYLNVQFGWAPLVSELQTITKTLLNLDSLLKKARKLQGKPQKVKHAIPPRFASQELTDLNGLAIFSDGEAWTEVPVFSPGGLIPPESSSSISGGCGIKNGYYLRTLETRRWFEGSFTSYFDYPDKTADFVTKAKALIGMEFTPTVLWELAPWSWLIDWALHIQDTISANSIASDESLVLNYGYVMEKSIFRTMFKGTLTSFNSYALQTNRDFFVTSSHKYFRRLRANPFGFTASSPSGLSANQVAILAALGLSK